MITEIYPEGIDCGWVGVDIDGHMGIFYTGGRGPIPRCALRELEYFDIVDNEINSMPLISDVDIMIHYSIMNSFIDVSSRGLFCYDWSDAHVSESHETKMYHLVTKPRRPIKVNDISGKLSSYLSLIFFRRFSFARGNAFDLYSHAVEVGGVVAGR